MTREIIVIGLAAAMFVALIWPETYLEGQNRMEAACMPGPLAPIVTAKEGVDTSSSRAAADDEMLARLEGKTIAVSGIANIYTLKRLQKKGLVQGRWADGCIYVASRLESDRSAPS